MGELTHVNKKGEANMVDVSAKKDQKRTAIAQGEIHLKAGTVKQIRENTLKKGDVLSVARIAGIQAAKQTANIIPLCHVLALSKVTVDFELQSTGVKVKASVTCIGKTGVEMEALHAVTVSLLTIYDMCKAVDKEMNITSIRLLDKKKEDLP